MKVAIEEFERYLKRRYPGRSTARHYVSDLRVFHRLVDKRPRDVARQDVSHFVEDQLKQGLSPATVNRRLACLRCFFEFLAGEADDSSWTNPVVWRRHRVKVGQALSRDLSERAVEQIFACMRHPRDHLMFSLMSSAGLRVGEVAALRMSDIIAANGGEAGPRLRVRGKGQKERVVPLSLDLARGLATWLAERPETKSDALFVTRRGGGFSERGIQERLSHYAHQAGIRASCHQLRHTFGRRMAEGSMPLTSLSKMLGHAHVTTTQVYIAGAGVDVRADFEAALERLEAECPVPPLPSAALGGALSPAGVASEACTDRPEEAVARDEIAEEMVDVSRFWAGLPEWLTQPLVSHIACGQRRWKPSQVAHHTRVRSYCLRQMWRWMLRERNVSGFAGLGRRDVEAYVEARLEVGIAASTLNRELRELWAFLRFVEDQGQPISAGIFRTARLKEPRLLPRFLSEEEYRRLEGQVLSVTGAGTAHDRLDRAWFYLLAHGGLRVGELCDLRAGDVHLSGRRVVIREGKGRQDRVIPLSETTVAALQDYLAARGAARSDHLLVHEQSAITPRMVQTRLASYGKAVGLKVWPHRLRHTLATRLVNVGMNIVSIQRLLGHDKLQTTMIYAHVHDTTVERDFHLAIARLETHEPPCSIQIPGPPLASQWFSLSNSQVQIAYQTPNCV